MAMTSVTGLMGAGMARAGHDVTVWNRTPEKARQLGEEDGVQAVESLADAFGVADFALTMLFDADAVTEVMRPTGSLRCSTRSARAPSGSASNPATAIG
jgi:3-hydroxyisobutyrate dehydrogenase